MKRFRVHWHTLDSIQAEVLAESEEEAILRVKAGQFIERTMDSEPGHPDFRKAYAEEIPPEAPKK